MAVKRHVMKIDEKGILTSISIDRTKTVLTRNYMMKKIVRNHFTPTRTIVWENRKSECKEPLDYESDKVVDQGYSSTEWVYKTRWNGYIAVEGIWWPPRQIAHYFIIRYQNRHCKQNGVRQGADLSTKKKSKHVERNNYFLSPITFSLFIEDTASAV